MAGAKQLICTSVHHTLPDGYVRNESERPRLDEVVPDATIPVVDLADPDRAAVVAQIGAACRSHGFFQVRFNSVPAPAARISHDCRLSFCALFTRASPSSLIEFARQVLNHGLPVELMQAAMAVGQDFFRLSPEEKAKLYSDDPAKKMRLSTSFNVRKETVHNWRDYLRLHCHPLEQFVPDWPANPPPFR